MIWGHEKQRRERDPSEFSVWAIGRMDMLFPKMRTVLGTADLDEGQ